MVGGPHETLAGFGHSVIFGSFTICGHLQRPRATRRNGTLLIVDNGLRRNVTRCGSSSLKREFAKIYIFQEVLQFLAILMIFYNFCNFEQFLTIFENIKTTKQGEGRGNASQRM